jgi:hypothetical protein
MQVSPVARQNYPAKQEVRRSRYAGFQALLLWKASNAGRVRKTPAAHKTVAELRLEHVSQTATRFGICLQFNLPD